jgi:prolyl 4-hydroxylase
MQRRRPFSIGFTDPQARSTAQVISTAPVQSVTKAENGHPLPELWHELLAAAAGKEYSVRRLAPGANGEGGIFRVKNFLTAEECQYLIHLAARAFPESRTEVHAGIRTSTQIGLYHNQSPELKKISSRISQLTQSRLDHGEMIQVIRYQPGEEFVQHTDYFEEGLTSEIDKAGNRAMTLIVYLQQPGSERGATVFPKQDPPIRQLCAVGDGVLFYNLKRRQHPSSGRSAYEGDPLATHLGEKVEHGEKWILTWWVRERKYPMVSPYPD